MSQIINPSERHEDELPAYEEIVSSAVGCGEVLPAYTKLPERQAATVLKSRRKCIWMIGVVAVLVAFAGAVTGSLLYANAKARRAAANAATNTGFVDHTISSLLSFECGAGSFILYQTNTSTVRITGSFRNLPGNYTGSTTVSTSVPFSGNSKPMIAEPMAAVCSTDEDLVSPGARIYLYYFVAKPYFYVVAEAVFTIPYGTDDLAHASIRPDITEIDSLGTPSSLAAVYVSSSGPRVYHLTYYDTIGAPSRGKIVETVRQQIPNIKLQSTTLNAIVRDMKAPIAATVAEPYPGDLDGLQEINVFFPDGDNDLCRIMYNREVGWHETQKLATYNTHKYINGNMSSIAAITPYLWLNVTAPLLYYISDGHVNEITVSMSTATLPRNEFAANFTVYEPTSMNNFPTPVSDPGLIAVSSWNNQRNRSVSVRPLNSDDGVENISIFFVRPTGAKTYPGEEFLTIENEGYGIVNVTGKSTLFGGFQ